MTQLVIDASVIVKWLVPQREDDADVEQALMLLEGVRTGRVRVHQPAHWLAETAACWFDSARRLPPPMWPTSTP